MTSKVKPALPLSSEDYDTCSRSYFVIEDANGCDLSDEEFNWISEASNNHDKLVESLREAIDLSKSPREHKEARERASKLLAELENDDE